MAMPPRARATLLVAACVAALLCVRFTDLGAALSSEAVRTQVERAGVYGPLAFSGLFVVATLAQVPGIPFLILAPALFGTLPATALCVPLAHVAVALNFELVRRLGGRGFPPPRASFLTRLFAQLADHPVRTVALLRGITIMFPPVTSALALTTVSRRDHFLGTLLGMTPPVLLLMLLTGWLLAG
jgi:uncharacterized membrane protein YdjX (TVP38/TMEM64 family)